MAKTSYFYVLYCRDGTLYGGYTTDINRRLEEHNAGTGAKYTRLASRRPVKMLLAEVYENRSQATKAEYHFKHQNRKKKEQYLAEKGIKQPYREAKETVIVDRREEDADAKKSKE